MKFIDLGRQYELIRDDVQHGINRVLGSQNYIMGEAISCLEEQLADFCGTKYCLTCGSGTEALQIPLMAYELKSQDAVFVPSFTFFASAESITLAGGTPIFVDINETYNIDPASLEMEINRVKEEGILNPRGIIAVDLFGRSADYDKIELIAEKHDLFLLEDAAQGFGGSLNGKRNGSFGNVAATSFFPAKPLGCYGDGGAIFTDDTSLYSVMKSIRVHGQGSEKYDNVRIGINGRMDTIQAAILLAKLQIFEKELQMRQDVASWYSDSLSSYFATPIIDDAHFSAWAQYTIRAEDSNQRSKIMQNLSGANIPTMIYYPIPLHKQTAYKKLGYGDESLPFCEKISEQVFSIPMHPYISADEASMVCEAILDSIQ